jgi:hypothetical protein
MADYHLEGLNVRDFEHLSQALALGVFGFGVTPFGDGRDGGREATFNGRVAGPTPESVWDGYGVLQCKFRQRPVNDALKDERDGVWAVAELERDLKKFLDPKRKLPRPDYYVFITNVKLSAVSEVGGKDRVNKLLATYKSKIGLKGFDIWDYDKICRLLDANLDVRVAYSAFITPGDVLETLRLKLTDQNRDFWKIIPRYLQEEFHNELWSRLEYAGQAAEHRVALAHVFVDLRFGSSPRNNPVVESQGDLRRGIVDSLLTVGAQRLKPSLCSKSEEEREEDIRTSLRNRVIQNRNSGRFVLIGGPGQGKSTVGQFLCQLYRAAFLKELPVQQLVPDYADDLDVFHRQCEANQMALPSTRRFPMRIELNKFATQLSKGEVNSVLDAIRLRINKLTDSECTKNDLRKWLETYPWAVIFDGLDEVPASSNRAEVMESIQQFRSEIHSADADVLILGTTRPQGYEDEFSPRYFDHIYLWPLSVGRALHYGERLAYARYRTEKENYELVTERLKTATEQTSTARLMRTPLQITIMATLVISGQPPQERWNLFKRYYDVVYNRETERDIPSFRILRDQKTIVTAIHQWCGLRLQRDGEREGKTDSLLSTGDLEELIRLYNATEGCDKEEIESRTREISKATTNRLVFLTSLQQDAIGFEIRSLQEFMAADALMDGKDEEVERRLEAIAVSPYWRNVFLFAAGKCFAEQRSRRSMVTSLCHRLNLQSTDNEWNDPLATSAYMGSRLALDILEEEMAHDKFRTQLFDVALELVRQPDVIANARLASLYEPKLAQDYRKRIEAQLYQPDFSARTGAWVVLKILCAQNVEWAEEIANSHWPADALEGLRIFELYGSRIPSSWASHKLQQVVLENDPRDVFSMLEHEETSEVLNSNVLHCSKLSDLDDLTPWLKSILYASQYKPDQDRLLEVMALRTSAVEGNETLLHFEIGCLGTTPYFIQEWRNIPSDSHKWAVYRAAGEFACDLTAENLADQLRFFAQHWKERPYDWPRSLVLFPWPFLACIHHGASQRELLLLADKVQQGKLGDLDDWLKAEVRWQEQGYTENDHYYLTLGHLPFDDSIAERGFPLKASSSTVTNNDFKAYWTFVWKKWQTAPVGPARIFWALQCYSIFISATVFPNRDLPKPLVNLTSRQMQTLMEEAYEPQGRLNFYMESLPYIIPPSPDESWMQFLAWLGKSEISFRLGLGNWEDSKTVAQYYTNHPLEWGILQLLACSAVCGNNFELDQSLLSKNHLNERLTACGANSKERHLALCNSFWIRLRQARLEDIHEIESLAGECVDLDKDDYEMSDGPRQCSHIVRLSLYLLKNRQVDSRQEELFISALMNRLSVRQYEQEVELLTVVNRLLMQRQSRLTNQETWLSLGLPAF